MGSKAFPVLKYKMEKKLADLINQKQKLQRWLTWEEKKKELFEETNTVSHILQQCIKL